MLPFNIMHSETQAKTGIVRIWKIIRLIIIIKNMYPCFTGTTLVFDRGKLAAIIFHISVLPVTLNCNFSQQTVNQLEINFGHNNNLEILVLLLARFLTSSSITKNNERNSKTGKKNLLPDTTIIRTKLKEQTSELLPQAQIFQTLHETEIGKLPYTQLIVNISNPILRAERINSSNCVLITGQPVIQQTSIQHSMPQINHINHEPITTPEGSSQSGGFTQTLYGKIQCMKLTNNNHEPPTVMEGVLTIRRVYSNALYEI